MKGRRGEVWAVNLDKRRPVVVVSNDLVTVEIDRMIATVTSKSGRNQFDVEIKDWEVAGLDKPSIVRCSKLNTVHNQELAFKMGTLSENDLKNVIKTLRSYFE